MFINRNKRFISSIKKNDREDDLYIYQKKSVWVEEIERRNIILQLTLKLYEPTNKEKENCKQ